MGVTKIGVEVTEKFTSIAVKIQAVGAKYVRRGSPRMIIARRRFVVVR